MVGRIALGTFVFLLLWFFDRTMATHDILKDTHGHLLENKPLEQGWRHYLNKHKQFVIFIARIGIVIGSLYITAPFLTQFVFKADIEAQIAEKYKRNIEVAKNELLGKMDMQISQDELEKDIIHQKLQSEVAGKQGSKYGIGPIAQTIEKELIQHTQDLEQLKQKRIDTENQINQAIINQDEQMLKSFGILIPKDSPTARQDAIQALQNEPAFVTTNRAVEFFLGGLGIILILAKILQPKSLQMYFSSRLQEKWRLYCAGKYDEFLPNHQKSTSLMHVQGGFAEEFEQMMIEYAQNKEIRERKIQAETLRIEQEAEQLREKERRQQEEREAHKAELAQSERTHRERLAKERLRAELAHKTRSYQEYNIQAAYNKNIAAKQAFIQKYADEIRELQARKNTLQETLNEAMRIYQSAQKTRENRQGNLDKAKRELSEMIARAQLLQKDTSLEGTRAFINTQASIKELKKRERLWEHNLLGFERDMAHHHTKTQKIAQQLQET